MFLVKKLISTKTEIFFICTEDELGAELNDPFPTWIIQ